MADAKARNSHKSIFKRLDSYLSSMQIHILINKLHRK
jgi:hypothetical protein